MQKKSHNQIRASLKFNDDCEHERKMSNIFLIGLKRKQFHVLGWTNQPEGRDGIGLMWLKMGVAAVHFRNSCPWLVYSITSMWTKPGPGSNSTAIVAPQQLPWLQVDMMLCNQSLRERFSRWYYTVCSHGAGIQKDLNGENSSGTASL